VTLVKHSVKMLGLFVLLKIFLCHSEGEPSLKKTCSN